MKVTRKAGKSEALRTASAALQGQQGKVGWFESAKTEDGKPVAGIAAVQELGSTARSIPPRSFFRTTAAEQRNDWAQTAREIARAVTLGKMPADSMGEALCLKAEGDVRAKIASITEPPLSPLTILARKDRREGEKMRKKAAKYGPQQPYTMGGKRIGQLAAQLNQGPPDLSGVSAKPLVDTGLMLATLTSQVTKK